MTADAEEYFYDWQNDGIIDYVNAIENNAEVENSMTKDRKSKCVK